MDFNKSGNKVSPKSRCSDNVSATDANEIGKYNLRKAIKKPMDENFIYNV